MTVKLREHQEQGINAIRNLIAEGHTRILRQAPTGAGKTTEFVYIASGAAKLENAIDIWVHREELIEQVSERLRLFNVPHGIVAPGQPRTNYLVQVCSVFTLSRRLDKHRRPDITIIDECHHAVAGSWRKCIDAYPNAAILGFTATPERLDGTGLDAVFNVLVPGPQVKELIAAGHLVQPITYVPPVQIDVSKFKVERGDYARKEMEVELDKPSITGDAVEHYKKICPGVPAIAFCVTVAHAEHVAAEFNAAGVKAAVLEGGMNDYQRKSTLASFKAGRYQVLVTVDLVSEGFDCPGIVCGILLRPTASLSLFLQQVGRCLRSDEASGKTCAYILDHVGNSLRHGLADDDRTWALEGRKKRKRGAKESVLLVVQCPECFAAFRPAANCPICGAKVKETAKRELEQVDGELVVADEQAIARVKQEQKKAFGRARSLEALIMQCHYQKKNWKYAYHVMNWRLKKDNKPQIPIPNVLPEKYKKLIEQQTERDELQQKLFKELAS